MKNTLKNNCYQNFKYYIYGPTSKLYDVFEKFSNPLYCSSWLSIYLYVFLSF